MDQNEGEMDFSLPSKKKKKKKVILTEGDDFPTEEGGRQLRSIFFSYKQKFCNRPGWGQ